MNQKQIENRALIVTVLVNVIITAAGIWMYFLTELNMMLLDGFFSFLALNVCYNFRQKYANAERLRWGNRQK